jgi:Flp pilus assembly protein TadG
MMRTSNVISRNQRAQSTIELALLMPLLVFLIILVFEFGRAVQAKIIVVNMSRECANLYSRPTGNTSPQDMMNALASTSQPLNMYTSGMMYLTKVQGSGSGPQIMEQNAWAAAVYKPSSRVGSPPTPQNPNPPANIGTLVLNTGDVAYIAEVFYKYNVIFSQVLKLNPVLYSSATF